MNYIYKKGENTYHHGLELWRSDYWPEGRNCDCKSQLRYRDCGKSSQLWFCNTTPKKYHIESTDSKKIQSETKGTKEDQVYLVMKLQWLCLMTCHITSSCCIFHLYSRRNSGLYRRIKNTRRTPLKLGRKLKSNTAKNKVEHTIKNNNQLMKLIIMYHYLLNLQSQTILMRFTQ